MNAYASLIGNANTGLGIQGRDKFADTAINLAFAPLSRQEVQALYRGSKICEKVVDLLPKAATGQNWLELVIGKGRRGIPGKAIQYADGLKFRSAVREASILGRLDGDGFVVLGIDDGRQPNEPVDEARIQQISWVAPLNRYQLFPNPNSGRPGHPEFYQVFLRQQEALGGKQTTGNIHRSRVLRFPGKQLYGDLILNNSGYNDSVLDAFWRSFAKYLTAIEYSARMVQDYNTFIYKLKGLANLILQGKEADILKRFRAIMLSMSSLGGLAIDNDNEDGQFISRNFGGLDGLIEKLKDDTSANAGMPPTKLWGSSQKHALSNSSEGDKYEWADCVDDWRGDVLDEPATDFFRYTLLAQNGPTGGRLPDVWNLKYTSALRLTLKEEVELRKDQTQGVDIPSVQAGILLPEEVRESAWAGAEYSIERALQPDLYTKQKAEKQQQPQPGQQLPDSNGSGQNGEGGQPATSNDDFLKNSQAEFGRSDAATVSNLPVTPEQLLDLKEITEEANPDGVDAIRDVSLDSQGRLTWIFRDENQLLRATLNGGELLTDYLGEASPQSKTDAAGSHLLDILDRTDRHLHDLEDGAIDRVNSALESAYEDLEAKLLKLYSQDEGGSVLSKHRALVLLSQVSDLLSLVNTRNADEIQQQFENLLRGAGDQGSTLAQELVQAIANEQLKPFAQVPIAAVRFAAQNAVQRLQKHSDDFREKASTIVTQGLIQGWGPDTIARQLRQQLDITQSRATTIARTEALAAHNEAAQDAYQANGIDAFQLIATQDDRLCPTCSARNMQVYKLGESKPPLHPRCRCYSLPWKSGWQQLGLTNDTWAVQFRQKSIAQLQEQGLEPDYGASPFEKANGQSAPTPLWSPSNLDSLNLDTWRTRGHGKARNCTKGRSCGGGCVAMHKQCRHGLSSGSAAKGEKIAKELGAKTGKAKGKSKKEAIGGGGAATESTEAQTPKNAPAAQPEVKSEAAQAKKSATKTKSKASKAEQPAQPSASDKEPTKPEKATNSTFSEVSNRSEFNTSFKEWSTGISEVGKHVDIHSAQQKLEQTQKLIKTLENLDSEQVKMTDRTVFPPRPVIRTKAEAMEILRKDEQTYSKAVESAQGKVKREASVDGERLAAASSLYEDIKSAQVDKANKIGGVKDANGKLAAAYVYQVEKSHLYLDYLVTSPENLFKDGSRSKGAGTEAIKQLVQRSIAEGKGGAIKLTALDDAKPFYEKLGFKETGKGANEMVLSASKAKELIK